MEKKRLSSGNAALLVMLWAASLLIMQLISQLVAPLLTEGWMKFTWTGLVELAFILIPLLVVSLVSGVNGIACIGSPKGDGKAIALAAGIALTGYPVMLLLHNLWILLLKSWGAVPEQVILPEMKGIFDLGIAILSVAGCAAFAEEIAMRGVLMPGLQRRMGNKGAVIITAAVFAAMHGSFSALPYTFLLGWLLGWMALRSRSLFPAMTFHFVNNAVATVLSFVSQEVMDGQMTEIMEITPQVQLMSVISLGFTALPAAGVLAVLLYFYRRVTPGVLPVERERGNGLWWLPLAVGALVFGVMVINSAFYEFSGGAACVSMWFA